MAVFFALREEIKKTKGNKSGKVSKNEEFEQLLNSIDLKEYQEFIRVYAAEDRKFKTDFELFFAGKDERIDVEKKYGELIQKLIRKHSDRGYIEYKAAFGLSKEVDALVKKGSEYAGKNNFRYAFVLAKAVIKPLMETMEYSDDSDGYIGDSIENIISVLETIAVSRTAAIDIKEQLLAYLQTELEKKIYFDYGDFGYSLFSIFEDLATQLEKHELFMHFVDTQISQLKGENGLYRKEYFQKSKISFLKKTGREPEASEQVRQNIHIVEVRLEEVNKAINKKDFAVAKKLLAEGFKLAESNQHPGTIDQWKKELLRIAVLENDITRVRAYTKYFAFGRWFSSEYYRQWKATFTTEEWREEIEAHIKKTIEQITKEWNGSGNKFWRTTHPPILQDLAPVYIEEKYVDRLLELVKQENSLHETLAYHSHLVKQYHDELLSICVPALKKHGIESNTRSEYADLARMMKKIIKEIPQGKEKIQNVAKELTAQFSSKPRRPAMIEELGKIL